jgi:hypothetical protein
MSIKLVKRLVLPAALTLLVSIGVFARSKNEHNIYIADQVQVGSTQLKPGDYKVEWQGPASSLKVTFLHYGKIVATTEGKMVEMAQPPRDDDIVTAKISNTQWLKEIDFRGKKDALVLDINGKFMK